MEQPTSKGTSVFRNTIAILLTLSMGAALSASEPTRPRLGITHQGRVITLKIEVPAYQVCVIKYALTPDAHPSQWYAFREFEGNVSDQVHELGLPAVGTVFFRAETYQIVPTDPIAPLPPAAAEQQKAGNEL